MPLSPCLPRIKNATVARYDAAKRCAHLQSITPFLFMPKPLLGFCVGHCFHGYLPFLGLVNLGAGEVATLGPRPCHRSGALSFP